MKNNWRYASLGQRERLSLIKNGNSDVYNTEKARNAELRRLRSDLGLSTEDVDDWDNIIDGANAAANDRRSVKNSRLPRFMNDKSSKATNEFNKTLKGLKSDYIHDTSEALDKADDELSYLSEWLANNGYSDKGSKSEKDKKEINDELEYILDVLKREFTAKVDNAKEKYLNQLRG